MPTLRELRPLALPILERHCPGRPDLLPRLLLPAIHLELEVARDSDLPVGASKIGGLPDLRGDTWPVGPGGEPMVFIAQINLAEVGAADEEKVLPGGGLLSFFLVAEVFEHCTTSAENFEVRLEPALSGLTRASEPTASYLGSEYVPEPHHASFCAEVHPYGNVTVQMADGRETVLTTLIFEDRAEVAPLLGTPQPDQPFLLGHPDVATFNDIGLREDEVALLTLPHDSVVVPPHHNGLTFAFVISRDALARKDFSDVRLEHSLS